MLAGPDRAQQAAFRSAFNTLCLAMPWSLIEAQEGEYHWDACDELVHWATQQELQLVGGPLIDFSGRGLPDWLWRKGNDLVGLCNQLSEFVTRVISRPTGCRSKKGTLRRCRCAKICIRRSYITCCPIRTVSTVCPYSSAKPASSATR